MITIRLSRYAKIFYSFLAASAVSCPIAASAQDLYVSNYISGNGYRDINKISPDGTVSTFATGLYNPDGLAFDANKNLYVSSDTSIQKIAPNGVVSTFASGFNSLTDLAFDASGNLYAAEYYAGNIKKITPNGTISIFASGLSGTYGLAFDPSGNLFESNAGTNTINKIAPNGIVSSFVTSGLNHPYGIAFDKNGNLFEADYNSAKVNKITPNGTVSTFASGIGVDYGAGDLAFDSSGNLFAAAISSTSLHGIDTKGVIYEITPSGVVSTFSKSVDPFGLAFAPSISTSSPTSVPEPFTIIGTLIGGTAAFRMRKKLKAIGS
jgi:sugar lactone lactonase YvrE